MKFVAFSPKGNSQLTYYFNPSLIVLVAPEAGGGCSLTSLGFMETIQQGQPPQPLPNFATDTPMDTAVQSINAALSAS
jgi:hypothetical protein